jgi:signal transduction histidine kinase
MRLKTKLVVAITGLVFFVVSVLSCLYLSQLLRQHIQQSYDANEVVAQQILFATRRALKTGLQNSPVDPSDPTAVRAAVSEALRNDGELTDLLNSVITYSPAVFDLSVADRFGKALVSTDPAQNDKLLPDRPDYAQMRDESLLAVTRSVFGEPRVYNVTRSLEVNNQPFATVRVGIRTSFVRAAFSPELIGAVEYTSLGILISLIVSAFVANLALKPIEDISERLDVLTQAESAGELEGGPSADAVVQVSHKIERIGRRMRNVEEVFSALKENLDQILANLQDGMILFTHDYRAVLVSTSVERFLGVPRDLILGATVTEIFDRKSLIGQVVREAFDARVALVQEEITVENGGHFEISLDFIHDDRNHHATDGLGALLTLHDLESVREIESELELSRRMAAIGRLTSGVGHEVKNPINAIVVHLELLRNKIEPSDMRAMRHLEIISSEIQRLDRVVQTLVDFSRPVELRLQDQDLRYIVSSVLSLASAELETRDVRVASYLPDRPVIAKVDSDLIKQAILNVVLNGAQAMQSGGQLGVRVSEDSRHAIISIHDKGIGIPDDVREKMFDLYFTTKKDGSGIGLAMTYRIVQLHNGQIDVESEPGKGTTFVLRIPTNNTSESRLRGYLETGTALSKEPRG